MTDQPFPAPDSVDEVVVSPPVGRALLMWDGKRRPDRVPVSRLQPVERFGARGQGETGQLIHGDNLGVLAHLLANGLRGQVRLIYIDPPFDSAADYTRPVRLRDPDARPLGRLIAYSDSWPGDSYLQFMYERLLLLRDLLADDGSIWLHCDYRQLHRLHLLLEEVFGLDNYLNTIAWRSQTARGAKVNAFFFPFSTQYIEIFAKHRAAPTLWRPQRKQLVFTRRQAQAQFMEDAGGFFRTSDPGTYSFASLLELHAQGRLYAPYGGAIVVDADNRRIHCSNGGNLGVKYYLTPLADGRFAVERGVDNLWDDIPGLGTTPAEDVGYPTQKTEALLRRVIDAATNPGDLVLDCFVGSGTSAVVAQQMGRRWIGCDLGYGAVQATRRRLQQRLSASSDGGFTLLAARDGSTEEPQPGPAAVVEATLQIRRLAPHGATMELLVEEVRSTAVAARLAAHGRSLADWRALVEAIEIDAAYDGRCFHPAVVDVPRKRRQQVSGRYTVPVRVEPVDVAVRITDILGNELLAVHRLP